MKKYRKPYQIKKKKSIFKRSVFWLSFFSLIILGAIFYFLFFSDFFQIEKVTVATEKKVSSENIKQIVENELEGKILFFRTKSIFLVNLNKIRENLLNEFPQIAEIEIKREFPDKLNLRVLERKEVGISCHTQPPAEQPNCFFLDKEGVVFENASEDSQLLKIEGGKLINDLKLGERVIEKELLTSILKIESKLKNDLKIPLKEAKITSEEEINFKTLEGWEIYFNPENDLNWQLTKLKAVLEEEIPLEKRQDLEYIDLRFGNLAPYKYR